MTDTETLDNIMLVDDDNKDIGADEDGMSEHIPGNIKEKRTGGCRVRDKKLSNILRELVTNALQKRLTVHVTGHSLGGGIATLLALDIIVYFPNVPVSRLHLWTFGAPQVADDVF